MARPARRTVALGDFAAFPDELICHILELLAPKDLGILACVSSVLYIFCNEDPLWMNLCLQKHEGLIKYVGNWKHTVLSRLTGVQGSSHASSKCTLHFEGFTSLFLYRRWYRCNVNLGSFAVDSGMIDRRHGLSLEEFTSTYDGKKPVLVTDLADDWPAMQTWSLDHLVKHYGDCAFTVAQDDDKNVLMRLKDYVSYMSLQHDEDPLYIFDSKFGEIATGLMQDYKVPAIFKEDLFNVLDDSERPPFKWLVMGPARSGASWHVDPALTSAWNTLLQGRKRWALYPPGRVPPSVVVHADEEDGDVDVDCPSSLQWWLDVYPVLEDEDKPLECVQVPGETIFVPSGWWHCVLNIDSSVAVTQNFVNSINLELVCLDLAPGYHHKGVARAGRLALQAAIDTRSGAASLKHVTSEEADEALVVGVQMKEWEFSVDFLASCMEEHANHFLPDPSKRDYLLPQSLRKWLQKLWLEKPDLRQQIWKGACISIDAKTWLDRVIAICDTHKIPLPTEDEKLPVGNGTSPVFLVGQYAIKLCVDMDGEEKAINGLASELQLYFELQNNASPLKHSVPDLLTSGILYDEGGVYTAIAWDGKGVCPTKSNSGNGNRGIHVLQPIDFYRTRWAQAVSNSLYPQHSKDNSTETRDITPVMYPYLVTRRCKGEDFAHMRLKMNKDHLLALAHFLGDQIRLLHCLPIPQLPSIQGKGAESNPCVEKQENNRTNYTNDSDPQENWICKVPQEWQLFVGMMRKQREHACDSLESWRSMPAHLKLQLEDYLPPDPVLLAGVHKVVHGVAQMVQPPVWLHMDVNDENIQIEPGKPAESNFYTMDSNPGRPNIGSIDTIKACYILDFADVCIGDPLYELVAIYLDVFRGNTDLLKCFLATYRLPLSTNCSQFLTPAKGWDSGHEHSFDLSYRAMCYSILHETSAIDNVFNIWKDLKMASSWREVEQKVWGVLNEYDSSDFGHPAAEMHISQATVF